MIKTFPDAGVLIASARGASEVAQKALFLLDNPERQLITSLFVRLEVLPKPTYNHQVHEVEFYNRFFNSSLL